QAIARRFLRVVLLRRLRARTLVRAPARTPEQDRPRPRRLLHGPGDLFRLGTPRRAGARRAARDPRAGGAAARAAPRTTMGRRRVRRTRRDPGDLLDVHLPGEYRDGELDGRTGELGGAAHS